MACNTQHLAYFSEKKRLLLSILIAMIFTVIELTGGVLSNSLALISDAMHLFSDVGALLLSVFVLSYAQKAPSKTNTFGYQRAEALGALISGLFLWGLMAFLVYEACFRFFDPAIIATSIVFKTALFALVANTLMLYLLHGNHTSLNTKAAYLHVLSDLLGSIGVLVNAVVIKLTNWSRIDPLITCIIAALVLRSSYETIAAAIRVLMEAVPKELSTQTVHDALANIPFVEDIHELHVWSISSKKHCCTAHLVSTHPSSAVLEQAQEILKNKFSIDHITLQIEPPQKTFVCTPCEKMQKTLE